MGSFRSVVDDGERKEVIEAVYDKDGKLLRCIYKNTKSNKGGKK